MSAPTNRVLSNASDLVTLLGAKGPLTIAGLSDQLTMPRSSVYRLVDGLCAIGLTEMTPDARVALTLRLLHLGDAARGAMAEWRHARTILATLAHDTGQTAFLTIPSGFNAVCIDWVPGRGIAILMLRPGRSLPFHAGAAGRVMLAFGGGTVERYLERCPLPSYTDRTLVTEEALRADVEQTRRQGYAISDEDVTIGIRSYGSPILRNNRSLIGAVSIGGVIDAIVGREDDFIAQVQRAADELAAPFRGKRRSSTP